MIRIIYNFVLVHLLLLLLHILVVVRSMSHSMIRVLVLKLRASVRILPGSHLMVQVVRGGEIGDLSALLQSRSLVLRVASWLLLWIRLESLLKLVVDLDSLTCGSFLRRWQRLVSLLRNWLLDSVLLVDKIVFDVLL